MTNKQALVNHCVWIASDNEDRPGDKRQAWESAKNYATLLPDWADIPDLLTQRMREKVEA